MYVSTLLPIHFDRRLLESLSARHSEATLISSNHRRVHCALTESVRCLNCPIGWVFNGYYSLEHYCMCIVNWFSSCYSESFSSTHGIIPSAQDPAPRSQSDSPAAHRELGGPTLVTGVTMTWYRYLAGCEWCLQGLCCGFTIQKSNIEWVRTMA